MQCTFDERPAGGVCRKCGSPVCEGCARVFGGDTLCKLCTLKMYSRKCSLVRYDRENTEEQ